MVQIQLDLTEEQNRYLEVKNILWKLNDKREVIKKIIDKEIQADKTLKELIENN